MIKAVFAIFAVSAIMLGMVIGADAVAGYLFPHFKVCAPISGGC